MLCLLADTGFTHLCTCKSLKYLVHLHGNDSSPASNAPAVHSKAKSTGQQTLVCLFGINVRCDRQCAFCGLQTFKEADLAGDGHISPEEWQVLVNKHPTMLSYMTLSVLKELTKKYPSFVFNENRQ